MELQLLESKDNETSFVIKGINPVYANTIRRIATSEVPTMAIDEINFIKNDSALYDEIVAHRLGLVPLKTDLKSYNLKEECTCKGAGCAKCTLKLNINTKGPVTVYSHDIQSTDPKVKPVYDKMPITLLIKNQKLELEATAILGKGKTHAKFSPGRVFYRAYPSISITQSKIVNPEKYVKVCPQDVYETDGKTLKIKDLSACDLCNACVEIADDDSIKVSGSKSDFIFSMESFGQLSNKEILQEAAKIFDAKLNEFSKKLKDSEESKITKIKKRIIRK